MRQTREALVKPTESENLYTGFLHTHPLPTPRNLRPCLPPSRVVLVCAFSSPTWGSETLPGFTCHQSPLSVPSGDHTYHSPRLPASRQL
eukprot:bmy_15805T0